MSTGMQIIVTILCSIFASTGFWSFLQTRDNKQSNQTKLVLGLAHDRIMYLGNKYIAQGHVTVDEYENLNKYLYEPYKLNGGNGSAERIMKEVDKLPIVQD